MSPVGVSDINWCSLGIEITYAPQDGEFPTDAQHAALRMLLHHLYARFGRLPVVGHGEIDKSKWPTEPHALNWTAAGLGPPENEGRFLTQEDALTPEQQRILDAAARHALDDAGIDHMMGINKTLGEQVQGLEYVKTQAQAERDQWMAEAERLRQLVTAGGDVDGLRSRLAQIKQLAEV